MTVDRGRWQLLNPLLENILNPKNMFVRSIYMKFVFSDFSQHKLFNSTKLVLDGVTIRCLPGTPCFRSYDEVGDLSKEMIPTLNYLSAGHSALLAPKHWCHLQLRNFFTTRAGLLALRRSLILLYYAYDKRYFESLPVFKSKLVNESLANVASASLVISVLSKDAWWVSPPAFPAELMISVKDRWLLWFV